MKKWKWPFGAGAESPPNPSPARIAGGAVLPLPPRSRRDAETNSIVMAVVQWAMRTFTEPPLRVRRDGQWDDYHPAALLLQRPHARLGEPSKVSGRQIRQALVMDLVLDGNAYLHKVRDETGQVIGLDWWPSASVTPVAMPGTSHRLAGYRVATSGGEVWMTPGDVLHFMDGIDPENPLRGQSPLRAIECEIRTDNEVAQYHRALMRAPAPSLLVTVRDAGDAGAITDHFVHETKRLLTQATAGDQAGGVVFPTIPLDVTPLGFSPEQMSLDRLVRLPEERITALLGVSALVLGLGSGMEHATFSNFREAREAAVESFLIPKWRLVAEQITDQLMPEFDPPAQAEFDLRDVRALQEDESDRHARVRENVQVGLWTADEGRAVLNRGVDNFG
ncbi:MAG: phage portal protein [Armatimonadota bacterium]